MEEKSIWRQKSGRASNNTCPLGMQSGWATANTANRLRQQCMQISLSGIVIVKTVIHGYKVITTTVYDFNY